MIKLFLVHATFSLQVTGIPLAASKDTPIEKTSTCSIMQWGQSDKSCKHALNMMYFFLFQVYKVCSDTFDSYDQHYGRGLVNDTIKDGMCVLFFFYHRFTHIYQVTSTFCCLWQWGVTVEEESFRITPVWYTIACMQREEQPVSHKDLKLSFPLLSFRLGQVLP